MKKNSSPNTCPYFTEEMDGCGIQYTKVRADKGMQAHVCHAEHHVHCKFYKKKIDKPQWLVLLVEDNYIAEESIKASLSDHAQCHAVLNAQQALHSYMLALKNKTYYDAVVISVQIPEMDGVEVIDAIRSFEINTLGITKGVPIIIFREDEHIEVKKAHSERVKSIMRSEGIEGLIKTITDMVPIITGGVNDES